MDLIVLVLVVAVVCFVVNWIVTNLVTQPQLRQLLWFVTILVLLFYVLRSFGVSLPNVIGR